MTAAGRNDRFVKEFATVDWMAYQGAPDGGGRVKCAFQNGGLDHSAQKSAFLRQ